MANVQAHRLRVPGKMATAQPYQCPRQVVCRKQPADIEKANSTNAAFENLRVAKAVCCDFDRRMSRFRADSELSRLNADPRETVPA